MPLSRVFQQDNDPKHTSKKAKNWFEEHKVNVMEWPAQSSDLNPIENFRADVKEVVAAAKPTTKESLCNVVKETWCEIPLKRCYGYGGYGGYGEYGGELYNNGYGNNYYSDESITSMEEDPSYNSYNKEYGYGGYGGYGGGLYNKGYGYGNSYYRDKSKTAMKEDPSYNSYSKAYGYGGYGGYGGGLYKKGYEYGNNYSDESKKAVKEDSTFLQ
ncbi:heterogeneous nuclear ribonucleoproteins A1 homolog [Hydra vulgaris]|uniref:heterogeneous nuclear ribonucleoproteins A1 homolog n=1 Tax=Hydra vulgaris TaxID=6087 RepID=UPI001F5F32D0|nr:heterogeneous nuclear ribonucleoproteins A1 homolog [Hydra vulgaris]